MKPTSAEVRLDSIIQEHNSEPKRESTKRQPAGASTAKNKARVKKQGSDLRKDHRVIPGGTH